MLEEEIQKIIDNDRTQSQQTAVQKSPNSTPTTAKCLKKDTLLTMLTEIIEHSGASDSTTSAGADKVNHFSSEPLVDYKVAVPLSGEDSTRIGFLYWHKLLGVYSVEQ